MEIGNGNWKWKLETELETELETGNGRQIFMLTRLSLNFGNTTCIEYSEVALASGPSSISMYIEKLGGPEDEASMQLTSY